LLALNLGWYGFHDLARSQPARRAFDLGPNEMTPIHQWNTGDTLPDIPLRQVTREGERDSLQLSTLPDRCAILIFFQSGCRACKLLATSWSGRSHLLARGETIPVRWVSVTPNDSAVPEFMISHNLPGPFLEAVRAKHIVDLGITRWPTVYIVGAGGILIRKPGLLPEDILTRPGGCTEWLAGPAPFVATTGS